MKVAGAASFDGSSVAAFENRLSGRMEGLISERGGTPVVVPSMKEIPLEENKEALFLADRLKNGDVDVLILLTGIGTRVLFNALLLKIPLKNLQSLFKKIPIVSRGPKPVEALKEFGLAPAFSVSDPGTWRDVLKILDEKMPVEGKTAAVQEYGEPNRLFLSEMKARGANVISVPVYRAALPDDTRPLSDVVERVVKGGVKILLFTNSSQADHLMSVARKDGHAQRLRRALHQAVVASIGPACTEALALHGITPDLEPSKPEMSELVEEAGKKWRSILQKKNDVKIVAPPVPSGLAKPGDALHQSLFLKACRREKTERTPVWLMRQAGRYMKEYRELRAKVPFLELCKNSDLAAEVTVDAAHRLGVDAAIIFSDLLPIVEPLGFKLSYEKNEGPVIANPFRAKADLARVQNPNIEDSMAFVFEAIRKTRAALKPNIPLIGFAGAPFTLASYIVEGGSSRNFVKTKSLMYNEPETWHALLEKITEATVTYVNAQVDAGAQAIQIFDSWVGCLSPEDFRSYALPHTRKLIQGVAPGVPAVSFGTQTAGLLPLFRQAGGDVIGVDWRLELDEAWETLGDVAVMGNFDPVALFSNREEIRKKVKRILNQAAGRPGHIFNLGHGILPETPIDNVMALIDAVKEFSQWK